jgi:hypothetical protein
MRPSFGEKLAGEMAKPIMQTASQARAGSAARKRVANGTAVILEEKGAGAVSNRIN